MKDCVAVRVYVCLLRSEVRLLCGLCIGLVGCRELNVSDLSSNEALLKNTQDDGDH